VINEDHGFVHRVEEIVFQKGILELGRFFTARSWKIVVVSNQSGVARGYFPEEDVINVHEFIREKFSFHRVEVTAFYFCPHYPPITGPCPCRKPEPGMILRAADDHHLSLPESVMVGDKPSDMEAAASAGIRRRYFLRGDYDYSPRRGETVVSDLREIINLEKRLDP
jgi:D-glycero-D-manno-heptose 1,7-bisphosphate phosphatase